MKVGVRVPRIKSMAKFASLQPVSNASIATAKKEKRIFANTRAFFMGFMAKHLPFAVNISDFHRPECPACQPLCS